MMAKPGEKRRNPPGDGNCGYSAYAYSLMAYLRFHPEAQETVFNNLRLSEAIKNQLIIFFDNDNENKKNWTDSEWDTIASVLREPLRDVAADRTTEILKQWADDANRSSNTDTYLPIIGTTSILEIIILKEKNSRHRTVAETLCSNLKKFILYNDLHDIQRVPAITAGIKKYVEKHAENITAENITDHTAAFLKIDQWQNIELYKKRLATNCVWASEETLGLLHKVAFNGFGDEPQTEIMHENTRKIPRKLPNYDNTEQKIRIINEGGTHWVSYIPAEFLINDTEEQRHTGVTKDDAAQTAAPMPCFFQRATRLGKTLAEQPILVPMALVTTFLLCCGAIATGITSVMGALLLCIAAIFLGATLALTVNQIYECSFRNKV